MALVETFQADDDGIIAAAKRLLAEGWGQTAPNVPANKNDSHSVPAGTVEKTTDIGFGRKRTFTVEEKRTPKVSPALIRAKKAALAAQQAASPSKLERPTTDELFAKFNERGIVKTISAQQALTATAEEVKLIGNPERETSVEREETRAFDRSRAWSEPDKRIEGKLTLDI